MTKNVTFLDKQDADQYSRVPGYFYGLKIDASQITDNYLGNPVYATNAVAENKKIPRQVAGSFADKYDYNVVVLSNGEPIDEHKARMDIVLFKVTDY